MKIAFFDFVFFSYIPYKDLREIVSKKAFTSEILFARILRERMPRFKRASQEIADSKSHEIAGMQIEIVPVDARDLELVRQAAVFKAT
ncbi:MAG TPA: hypothetical protein VLZ44_01775, partial [Treponemataceae bacterium]|nr:hypothetical protein [Treponemataceae bacterium]